MIAFCNALLILGNLFCLVAIFYARDIEKETDELSKMIADIENNLSESERTTQRMLYRIHQKLDKMGFKRVKSGRIKDK